MAKHKEMADTPEQHRQRSEFIRQLVQHPGQFLADSCGTQGPPRTIIQFWDNPQTLPRDVERCIATWTPWTNAGFTHHLFDERSARAFIRSGLGTRHERAFGRCYHPAMKADYFRMCYLFAEGGFYVDADDCCLGVNLDWLFTDGRLKIQPLCYDTASGAMVDPAEFLHPGAGEPGWIFYFNNNPMVAPRGHPVIERALQRATDLLELAGPDGAPEIQETTGPGNLSRSIFELGTAPADIEGVLMVLRDWHTFAVSKWPLSYRNDARNWRLSNQQRFPGGGEHSP